MARHFFSTAQELNESRGGRPGLPVPNSPYGLCGRKATLQQKQHFFSAPTITAVHFLLLLFTLIYFLNSFKACGHVNTCIHQAYPELIYADYAMVYKKEEEEESQTNRKRSKGKNIQTKLYAYIHNNNSNNRKVFKKNNKKTQPQQQ